MSSRLIPDGFADFRRPSILEAQGVFLFLALLVYGIWGSPTPDNPGIVEALVAVLLLLAVSLPKLETLSVRLVLLPLYGFTLPLLAGALAGHGTGAVLRDLAAFLFLLLPLILGERLKNSGFFLLLGVALVGSLFSIRAILPYGEEILSPWRWIGMPPRDLLYLANSPEVLFTAIILSGSGFYLVWARQKIVTGLAFFILSLVPLLAMSLMMQRAGIGCFILSLGVLAVIGVVRRPERALPALVIFFLLSLPFLPFAKEVLVSLAYKTQLVGLNSRVQEWDKVLELISVSPWTLLFGLGWGAVFENPAVGNLEVNYTHSLISAMLLKTGLAGTGLTLVYLAELWRRAWLALRRWPVLGLALLFPLGIGLFLYASYKCLGFGLLLILLKNQATEEHIEIKQISVPYTDSFTPSPSPE